MVKNPLTGEPGVWSISHAVIRCRIFSSRFHSI